MDSSAQPSQWINNAHFDPTYGFCVAAITVLLLKVICNNPIPMASLPLAGFCPSAWKQSSPIDVYAFSPLNSPMHDRSQPQLSSSVCLFTACLRAASRAPSRQRVVSEGCLAQLTSAGQAAPQHQPLGSFPRVFQRYLVVNNK